MSEHAKFLITGGLGFIGQSVVRTLLERGIPDGHDLRVGQRALLQQFLGAPLTAAMDDVDALGIAGHHAAQGQGSDATTG